MSSLATQLFVGADGKLRRKKPGQAARPSRTRRLIKVITTIKKFSPGWDSYAFASQRTKDRPEKMPRKVFLAAMLRDLTLMKRDVVALARTEGRKQHRFTAPEKKLLRKELLHFRAEILGKVASSVASNPANVRSARDEAVWGQAKKSARKQYPGLWKRIKRSKEAKGRFYSIVNAIYGNMGGGVGAVGSVPTPLGQTCPNCSSPGVNKGTFHGQTYFRCSKCGNEWAIPATAMTQRESRLTARAAGTARSMYDQSGYADAQVGAVADSARTDDQAMLLKQLLGTLLNKQVALVGPEGQSRVMAMAINDTQDIDDSGYFGVQLADLGWIFLAPASIQEILLPPYTDEEIKARGLEKVLARGPAAILITDKFEA